MSCWDVFNRNDGHPGSDWARIHRADRRDEFEGNFIISRKRKFQEVEPDDPTTAGRPFHTGPRDAAPAAAPVATPPGGGIRQDMNDPHPWVDGTYAAPQFMLRGPGDRFFCPFCDKVGGHFAQQCEGWAKAAGWPENPGYQGFLAAVAARKHNQARPVPPTRRSGMPKHEVKPLAQLRAEWLADQENFAQNRGWKIPFGVPYTDAENIRCLLYTSPSPRD